MSGICSAERPGKASLFVRSRTFPFRAMSGLRSARNGGIKPRPFAVRSRYLCNFVADFGHLDRSEYLVHTEFYSVAAGRNQAPARPVTARKQRHAVQKMVRYFCQILVGQHPHIAKRRQRRCTDSTTRLRPNHADGPSNGRGQLRRRPAARPRRQTRAAHPPHPAASRCASQAPAGPGGVSMRWISPIG